MLSYDEIISKIKMAEASQYFFIGLAIQLPDTIFPEIRITSTSNAKYLIEQYQKRDNILAIDSNFDANSLFNKLFTECSQQLIMQSAFKTVIFEKEMTEECKENNEFAALQEKDFWNDSSSDTNISNEDNSSNIDNSNSDLNNSEELIEYVDLQ